MSHTKRVAAIAVFGAAALGTAVSAAPPATSHPASALNTARIEELTGAKGALDEKEGGSDDRAVVDGDFAMLESELQPVLKALRHAGINIVAIHQHMAGEQPRILFLHYWGIGPAESLPAGCGRLST
jgi:hypothetical protein